MRSRSGYPLRSNPLHGPQRRSEVLPGEYAVIQRKMKCMKEHENELSPACKERIAEMKNGLRESREACQYDALKLCKDVKPGGGRIVSASKEHVTELSPECKARMEKGQMRNQHPSPAY